MDRRTGGGTAPASVSRSGSTASAGDGTPAGRRRPPRGVRRGRRSAGLTLPLGAPSPACAPRSRTRGQAQSTCSTAIRHFCITRGTAAHARAS